MKRKLPFIQTCMLIGTAAFLFACKGSGGNADAGTAADSLASQVDTTAAPAGPTVPFNAVVIRHTVADYDKWRPIFDADSTARNQAGMHLINVSRGIDNPNDINIPFMIEDVAKVKAFAADPRLKDVMQKGGVTSAPNVKLINVLRMNEVATQKGDYLEISHKVKDFNKWLQAFDGEGPATRSADGLTDGVLARGIEDTSMVYLVFAINDVAKAKAALANPARQKLMMDAGVIGKPEIFYGRDQ